MKPQGSPHLGQVLCHLSQADEPTALPAGPWWDCVHAAGATPPRTASGSSLQTKQGCHDGPGVRQTPWVWRDFPTPFPRYMDFSIRILTTNCYLPSLLSVQPPHPANHHPQDSESVNPSANSFPAKIPSFSMPLHAGGFSHNSLSNRCSSITNLFLPGAEHALTSCFLSPS